MKLKTGIKKLYWEIGEVADAYSVSQSNIRFWCDQFEIQVRRSTDLKRTRKFDKNTLFEVHLCYVLVQDLKFTLPGTRAILQQYRSTQFARADVLDLIERFHNLILKRPMSKQPLIDVDEKLDSN